MKTLFLKRLAGYHAFCSVPGNEITSTFVTHTHKSFNISRLWLLFGMILLCVVPLGLLAQTCSPESENYTYNAIYLPGSDDQANPPLNSPDGFMARPNTLIINDLKRLNCNTVFLYVKLHTSNENQKLIFRKIIFIQK